MRFNLHKAAISVALMLGVMNLVSFGQTRDTPRKLEGAWNVRVSQINCQTGGVIRSFDSVTTFMSGGTLIDSTSGIPQALKTPGEGVWEHMTAQNFRFKFKSFSFDAAGNYTGYNVI